MTLTDEDRKLLVAISLGALVRDTLPLHDPGLRWCWGERDVHKEAVNLTAAGAVTTTFDLPTQLVLADGWEKFL